MVVLGSVFLGDAHQYRLYPTTPPTSPPPIGDSPLRIQQQALRLPNTSYMSEIDDDIDTAPQERTTALPPEAEIIPSISPELSLELRLRWLEALLFGVRQELAKESRGNRKLDSKDETAKKASLLRRAEEIQQNLNSVIQNHEGIRKFMDRYEQYAQYLTPAFSISGIPNTGSSLYQGMSSTEIDALLSEMETDIQSADRDLREIDELVKRGVAGAGKLPDHASLQPRLDALIAAHQEDLDKANALEKRIANLLEQHATKVDALSELFVAWNDVITEAEDIISKTEREKERQRRLGYE